MAGLVYALSGEGSPFVKIGWTNSSPEGRIAALQPSSPLVLRALWVCPGGLAMEQHLHATFSDRRLHNEWFDFSGEDAIPLLEAAYNTFTTQRQHVRRPGSRLRGEPSKGVRLYGEDWERLFRSGETLKDIGVKYGFTREYVRLVLRDMGVPTDAIREQRRVDRQVKKVRAAMERALQRPPCIVCGAWVIRSPSSAVTCSKPCSKALALGRYHLDDSRRLEHRRVVARRIVNNPWLAKNQRQLEYSRAVLSDNPPPPNRRWVGPTSRARRALEAAGIEVPGNGRRILPTTPCSATNLDGSPCSRRVSEGETCHIHLRSMRAAS